MAVRTANLQRKQLDDVLRAFPSAKLAGSPRGGWIRSTREALGMTQSQLGQRLGVSRQSVQDFEKAEVERRITLESLDRVARAIGCRLVHGLVPESGSLEDLRKRRADEIADSMLERSAHSMKLEAQAVPKRERERQRKSLVDALLAGSPRKLWQ